MNNLWTNHNVVVSVRKHATVIERVNKSIGQPIRCVVRRESGDCRGRSFVVMVCLIL